MTTVLIPSYQRAFKSTFYIEETSAYEEFGPTWNASLKVDYDTNRNPLKISLIKKTQKYMHRRGMHVWKIFVGKTRKGWHLRVWIQYNPLHVAYDYYDHYWLPAATTLKLQSMLGDDPFRQKFNASRVRRKKAGYNVLFTHKYYNGKLIGQEVFDPEMTKKVENIFRKSQS